MVNFGVAGGEGGRGVGVLTSAELCGRDGGVTTK